MHADISIRRLLARLETLEAEVAALRRENQQLRRENQQLRGDNQRLCQANELLRRRYTSCIKICERPVVMLSCAVLLV